MGKKMASDDVLGALAMHVASFDDRWTHVSTFEACLRDARAVMGRDLKDGKLTGKRPVSLFAGAATYLVLLEQIGESLRPLGARDIKYEKAIERALRQFNGSQVSKRQREVLYALRCALAHEYGLVSQGRAPKFTYRVFFRFEESLNKPLIAWPRRKWDGDFAHASLATSTTVNLVTLAEVVEQTVRNLRNHVPRKTLRSRVPIDELVTRFGFTRSA